MGRSPETRGKTLSQDMAAVKKKKKKQGAELDGHEVAP